jgi:S-formylglutathione hydrolase FrmB
MKKSSTTMNVPDRTTGSGAQREARANASDRGLVAVISEVLTASTVAPRLPRVDYPAGNVLESCHARHPRRRYPVLYLLHGTSGGAADGTTMGNAEQATAGRPLIVVMPDIALHDEGGGWCTNWWNAGKRGAPEWERFHIDQLLPWVDHNLRTIRSRSARAIAGLSQGGFCSMSYAARHPDLFGTVTIKRA